ncbi:14641_t:CDS:2, partial [Gigaspora margarita]
MARHNVECIELEVRFAPDYPNLPPYIRVLRPRLLRFMNGGGGHVTAGGSVCMELLTLGNSHDRGWYPEYTMEAVLLQVKLALSSLNPPARLDHDWRRDYNAREAMDGYIRSANLHGWGIPPHWTTLFKQAYPRNLKIPLLQREYDNFLIRSRKIHISPKIIEFGRETRSNFTDKESHNNEEH